MLSAKNLAAAYDEISEKDLVVEIPRLRRHINAAQIDFESAKYWTALEMLTFIVEWDFLETLPNISLALKLFLTICVSVASCERSFSKLKLMKTYLRSSMRQTRVSDLAILSIENELASNIDFDEVISNFAALKVRKVSF